MAAVPWTFTARETKISLVVVLALEREPAGRKAAGDSWKGSSVFRPTEPENPSANGQEKETSRPRDLDCYGPCPLRSARAVVISPVPAFRPVRSPAP